MRPNLVISPEELGRDDIQAGVPPAEVRRWAHPPDEIEVVLMRAPKASYPEGVVAFWKAANACEQIYFSNRCKELSEEVAVTTVRSYVRRAHVTHVFELRSGFVAAQEMEIAEMLHMTVLIETAREYIVAQYLSTV